MKLKFDKRIVGALIITSLLIFISFYETVKNNRKYVVLSGQFRSTNMLMKNIEDLQLQSYKIIDGFTAFEKIEKEDYIKNYNSARNSVEESKKKLAAFSNKGSKVSNEMDNVFSNVDLLIAFGDEIMNNINNNNETAVLTLIASHNGDRLMMNISKHVLEIERKGRDQLRLHSENQEELAKNSNRIYYTLAVISFLIILIIFTLLQVEFNRRIKAKERIYYLASLVANVKDAIISTNEEFIIKSWNKAAEEMYGYTELEAVGKSINELLKIADSSENIKTTLNELRDKGFYKGEHIAINKNGESLNILDSINVINHSGSIKEYVAVHSDISKQKKLEEKLHQLNHLLEEKVILRTTELTHIFERITDAFVALDINLCCTYVNKRAGEIFNRYPENMIGKNIWTEFPEGFGQQFYKAYHVALSTQKYVYLEEYYAPYDLWFENHIYPSPQGLSIYFNDITERKKATEKIRISESRLAKSQQVAHLGSWQFDFNNNVYTWSDEAYRIFGVQPDNDKLTLENWTTFIHADDLDIVLKKLKESRDSLSDTFFNCRIVRNDGIQRHIYSESKFEYDAAGKPSGIFSIIHDITEVVIAQEQLRQSEIKLRTILQSEPECVKLLGPQCELLEMNPAGLAMIEADSLEQVKGKNILSLVDENYREAFANLTTDVFQGNSGILEFKIRGLKGSQRWLETNAVALKEASGKVISLLGITRDITEKKKSEIRYKALAEVSPVGIFHTDANGLTTYVNPSWCNITGLSIEDALGNNWLNAVHDGDRNKILKDWKEAVKMHELSFSEYRFVVKDGSVKWVMGQAIPERNNEGVIIGYVGTITDITERKITEQELLKSEERYRGLLNNLETGIVVHRGDTSIADSNPKAEELLGLSDDQMKGKLAIDPDWKFLADDYTPLPLEKYPVNQILKSKQPMINFVAGVQRPKTNDIVWLVVNGFPMFNINNEITEIVISFIDITERNLMERELQQSNNFLNETQLIANLGTYTMDIPTGNWTCSKELDRIFGIDDRFEKSYENWPKIVHPDWRKKMTDYFNEEVIGSKTKFDKEYKIIRIDDQQERWVHGVGSIKYNNKNEPILMVGTIRDITKSKIIEEAIKASEEKYRTLVEQASDAIFTADAEGRFITVNSSLCKLSQYSEKELLQMTIYDFTITEDLQKNPFHFDELRQGKTVITERLMKGKGGIPLYLEINAKLLTNGNLLVFVRDVSERKKAEEIIRKSEEKYRQIVETANEGILVIDEQDKISFVNEHMAKMLGYQKEEMIGRLLFDFMDDERKLKTEKYILNRKKGIAEQFEFIFQKKNGDDLYTYIVTNPINDGSTYKGALAMITDITETKKVTEALRENEERYRALVENAPEALVVMDMELQRFVNVSQSAVELFKMSRDQLLTFGVVDVSPEFQPNGKLSAEFAMEKIKEAIAGGKPEFEWTHKNSEGLLLPCEIRLVRLPAESKILIRGSIRDITDRKRAEHLLNVQFTTAQALSQLETIEECVLKIFKSICENLNWDFAALWMVDEATEKLYYSDFWYASSPLINDFGKLSKEYSFSKGIGLPGRVLESRKPLWIKDIQLDKNFPRSIVAHKAGLHGAFAFPIQNADKVVAVLEVFSHRIKKPDKEIQAMFDSIGKMICQFILRKKAEEELTFTADKLRKLTTRSLNIREEEGTRIAREIHDELGQQLTGLKMDASWIRKKSVNEDQAVNEKIESMISLIDDAVKTVRRIASELRPGILDDLGLIAALEWLCHEFEKRTEIKCNFESEFENVDIEKNHASGIFRIYQEALTNITRHSQATKVETSIERDHANLVLKIVDNGTGFDMEQVKYKNTLGLLGMNERALMLGCELTIYSIIGKGTTIILKAPLNANLN